MRFSRLIAFASWVAIALLSVASFAAFSPKPVTDDPASVTTATPDETGEAAGRQAAFGLARQAPPPSTANTIADTDPLEPPDITVASTTTTTTRSTVTRPTPPTTAPAGGGTSDAPTGVTRSNAPILSTPEVWALMAAHFAPEDVERAVAVAWCESHFDAGAYNSRSGASGLFQHMPRYWDGRAELAGYGESSIFDPGANAAVAAWLVYSHGGWKHWAASKSCWSGAPIATTTTTSTTTTTILQAAAPPPTTATTSTIVPPSTTTTTTPPPTTTVPPSTTTTTTTLPTTTSTTTTTVPATTTTTVPPSRTTTTTTTTTIPPTSTTSPVGAG